MMLKLILISIIYSFGGSIKYLAAAVVKGKGFSLHLIHRDSPLSPFYNSSITPSESMKKAALRSLNKGDSLYSTMHLDEKFFGSDLVLKSRDYLIKIYLGKPVVGNFAIAHLGSDLMWFKSAGCSSKIERVPYDDDFCGYFRHKKPSAKNNCEYKYYYSNLDYTSGMLSTDTFYLESPTSHVLEPFNNTVFGCSVQIPDEFNGDAQGVVGLGRGPLSLIRQLKTKIEEKFSYCLLPLALSESQSDGRLRFGSRPEISGTEVVSIPLATHPSHPNSYYLSFNNISFGDKETTMQRPSNIRIDFANLLILLPTDLYNELETIVKQAIGKEPASKPPHPFIFCYEEEKLHGIELPEMVFHFTDAKLHLHHTNTFMSVEEHLCMAVHPSDSECVLGSVAQVDLMVEFDLQREQVSLAQFDCAKF